MASWHCLWQRLRPFKKDRRGTILIETAILLPVLTAATLALTDIGLYVLAHQKSQRAATTVGDLVARMETVSAGDVENMIDAAEHVMRPFGFAANGSIVVSSVTKPEGEAATVDWQISETGGTGLTSHVGAPGGPAALANGLVLEDEENIIIAEVEYDYRFLFTDFLASGAPIYHDAFFRVRGEALSELN